MLRESSQGESSGLKVRLEGLLKTHYDVYSLPANVYLHQWLLKAQESLPTDYPMFCLVVGHLLRNAHRYFNIEHPSDFQRKIVEEKSVSEKTRQMIMSEFKLANQKVRQAGILKSKNRLVEQEKIVDELKKEYVTYRNLSSICGIPLKTVHSMCTKPRKKFHKASEIARKR